MSGASGSVLQGLRAPRALIIPISASVDTPDLSSSVVTGASLRVGRGDGREQMWTCTVQSQTTALLTVAHPWVVGDNDVPGETIRVYVQLATAAGVVECDAVTVTVRAR